jgi:hypothetical protein
MKIAKIMLILILLYPFYGYAFEIGEEEILLRPSRSYVEHIFLEQESIIWKDEGDVAHNYHNCCPTQEFFLFYGHRNG